LSEENKDGKKEEKKEDRRGKKRDELIELQSIRNLLILQLIKNGASSDEIDLATKMGAGNIRNMFPGVKKKGKSQDGN
jgi:hypothetical protein